MGNTRNTGYLQNIVLYDANDNITLPARLAVTGTVSVNNTTPYDTTQFSLDVNGGLIVKNINKTAQFVLINSNPASGGNNAFVVHTVGGTSASSYADIQGYYGTSIAGSTVLRLNPQGGNVLVGSLAGTGSRMVVADATGVLSTQAIVTLGDLSGVSTARTLTINGTTYDLSANRTWTLYTDDISEDGSPVNLWFTNARARAAISVTGSGSYDSATGVITVTGGVTAVNTKTGDVTLTTSDITEGTRLYYTDTRVGTYLTSNSYATQSYVTTQIANLVDSAPGTLDTLNELAAALGDDPNFATSVATSIGTKQAQLNGTGFVKVSGTTISYDNSTYLTSFTETDPIYVASSWYSTTNNASNWNTAYGWGNHASAGYLTTSSAASTYASLTGSYANPSWITSLAYSKLTGVPSTFTPSSHTHAISEVTGLQTALDGKQATLSSTPSFDQVITTNNGNGTNFRIGDDVWIGDINVANTFRIQGVQDSTQAYIVFGNSNATALGRTGTGALTYGGNTIYHAGNLTNLNQLSNGPGYITGITSSDVTTALGFTPYNATNPSGYITSSSLSSYLPLSGGTLTGLLSVNSSLRIKSGSATGILLETYNTNELRIRVTPLSTTFDMNLVFPSVSRTYTYPNATGTLALTSDIPTNTNQLTNGAGYITSYTETDTLSSVVARGASTSTGITINPNGTSITMGGGGSAEGIRMQASTSTTYPVFLRSVNPSGGGETSAWLFKEDSTPWGIWHNNPINTYDFTSAGSGGIAQNVGGGTNQVMVRIDPGAGYVQTAAGFKNSAGTITLDNSGNISGNASTATNVAWTGVTGRPTALSSFTNDLGNYGGWITGVTNISGYSGSVNIPDWRNTSYTPAQYDGNRVNWHFNNTNYNDSPPGDFWGAMQTVSPWSEFNVSHRQSQLWWGGSVGLSYRYALGSGYTPTGWSSWERIITSATISSQPVVTIQDGPPSGTAGRLWWESDTGKLKVYYGSAWVDASPIPDSSLFFAKAGGVITGDVSIGQTLNVVGNTLVQGNINAFGDITAYSSSDSRLKDNITIIESPLEKLSKINGVSFNWNDKQSVYEVGAKDYGVIAQEVEEVLPELVTTRDNGYKAVRYEKIVSLLIEAIKEQQTQINNLTDKLNKL